MASLDKTEAKVAWPGPLYCGQLVPILCFFTLSIGSDVRVTPALPSQSDRRMEFSSELPGLIKENGFI